MIHAYDKSYLAAAQKNLARRLDYLVNDLHHPLETAWQWFLTSELSARFEQGDCSVLVGMSGVWSLPALCWSRQAKPCPCSSPRMPTTAARNTGQAGPLPITSG